VNNQVNFELEPLQRILILLSHYSSQSFAFEGFEPRRNDNGVSWLILSGVQKRCQWSGGQGQSLPEAEGVSTDENTNIALCCTDKFI
jgi:hypothetical protein